MKLKFLLLLLFFQSTFGLFAQSNEHPYAIFGYEGKVLKTPQERQHLMLLIPNTDTTSNLALIGIEPSQSKYYFFDKNNKLIYEDTLSKEQTARFLSVDPLAAEYPWYTPFQFAGNKPIHAIDLDGLEEMIVTKKGYTVDRPIIITANRILSDQESRLARVYGRDKVIHALKNDLLRPYRSSFKGAWENPGRSKVVDDFGKMVLYGPGLVLMAGNPMTEAFLSPVGSSAVVKNLLAQAGFQAGWAWWNGDDFSAIPNRIDYADVASVGIGTVAPYGWAWNWIIPSTVDYTVEGGLKSTFASGNYNKDLANTSLDLGINGLFYGLSTKTTNAKITNLKNKVTSLEGEMNSFLADPGLNQSPHLGYLRLNSVLGNDNAVRGFSRQQSLIKAYQGLETGNGISPSARLNTTLKMKQFLGTSSLTKPSISGTLKKSTNSGNDEP